MKTKKLQNDLLLRVLRKEDVSRPPIWLMRQAGRILPEYRAIRGSLSGFKELVSTPELAAEVTIQPVDALNVDAAIIFSDILVIPEAMGLDYQLIEKKGPWFPETIKGAKDVAALIEGEDAASNLSYVYDALAITKKNLDGRVPLIGFAGAPWTLLCYMIEGSGSKTFSKAKKFLYTEPVLAHTLLQKLTNTIIAYTNEKVKAGADVIQIFDSWAGILNEQMYSEFALPYLKQIKEGIESVPKILFPKGAWFSHQKLSKLGYDAYGIDWHNSVSHVRSVYGKDTVLQGNMDPCQLYADHDQITDAATRMCQSYGKNHIANLGHGVYPDTQVNSVKSFINAVKSFKY